MRLEKRMTSGQSTNHRCWTKRIYYGLNRCALRMGISNAVRWPLFGTLFTLHREHFVQQKPNCSFVFNISVEQHFLIAIEVLRSSLQTRFRHLSVAMIEKLMLFGTIQCKIGEFAFYGLFVCFHLCLLLSGALIVFFLLG